VPGVGQKHVVRARARAWVRVGVMPVAIEGEAVGGDELRSEEYAQVAEREVEDVDGRLPAAHLRRHLCDGGVVSADIRVVISGLRLGHLRRHLCGIVEGICVVEGICAVKRKSISAVLCDTRSSSSTAHYCSLLLTTADYC